MTEPILVDTRILGILALALASLGGLWLSRRLCLTWFNPLSLYLAIWGGSLISCLAPWLGYGDLMGQTWCCLGLAAVGFTLGVLTIHAPYLQPVLRAFRVPTGQGEAYATRLFTVFVIAVSIKVLYVGMKLLAVKQQFGSITAIFAGAAYRQLLLEQSGAAPGADLASKSLLGSLFGFADAIVLIALVWGAYYVTKKRYIGLLPLILETVHSLLGLERFRFIVALLIFISSLYFHHIIETQRGRERKAIPAGRLALFTAIGVLTLLAMLLPLYLRHPDFTIRQLLAHTGSYFVSPILAFNAHVARVSLFPEPLGWGLSTFWGAASWLQRFGLLDALPPLHYRYVQLPFGDGWLLTNVYTYLINALDDWGVLGVLLWPYVLGVACGFCHERVVRYRSLALVPILCLLMATIFLSFYTLLIKQINYMAFMVGSLALAPLVIRPRPRTVAAPAPDDTSACGGTVARTARS